MLNRNRKTSTKTIMFDHEALRKQLQDESLKILPLRHPHLLIWARIEVPGCMKSYKDENQLLQAFREQLKDGDLDINQGRILSIDRVDLEGEEPEVHFDTERDHDAYESFLRRLCANTSLRLEIKYGEEDADDFVTIRIISGGRYIREFEVYDDNLQSAIHRLANVLSDFAGITVKEEELE